MMVNVDSHCQKCDTVVIRILNDAGNRYISVILFSFTP